MRPARHVTGVHKDTVFKLGCGMFAEECRKVASEYPGIAYDEVMVDTFALKLAMQPQQFDVVVRWAQPSSIASLARISQERAA
jgi:3-isopropylmalate dehydrogenase